MKKSLEKHSDTLFWLVQEIHTKPQPFIEPLEACLTEAMHGLTQQVRAKMAQLQEEKLLDAGEGGGEAKGKEEVMEEEAEPPSGVKRDRQEQKEEGLFVGETAFLEPSDQEEVEKRRKLDQEKEDGDGIACLYCNKVSDALVLCDGCDHWFHAQCAGYDGELLENPVRNGRFIELKAYCGRCLENAELDHSDILAQQDEYLKLNNYFEDNAFAWRWESVPQDGFCCLKGIWTRHAGNFDTLEQLISACAHAAVEQVDVWKSLETRGRKQRMKTEFRELAKDPERLREMWHYLEVQYLWLALANTVLHEVQLKLYVLEDRDGGSVELRCMQRFPEEGNRAHTIGLLQWNRKVAAHFDLLEEIICAPDTVKEAAAAEVPEMMEVVDEVPHLSAMVDAEVKFSDSLSEKADGHFDFVFAGPQIWHVGEVLEAEMADPNCPRYWDTLHPVQVTEVLNGGKEYQCRMLAFREVDVDVWTRDLLHEPRDFDENPNWMQGDVVHFRIRRRRIGKDNTIDGSAAKDGIWAKGVVSNRLKNGDILVEHRNWDKIGKKRVTRVSATDVRWAVPRLPLRLLQRQDFEDTVVFQKEVESHGFSFNMASERARLAKDPLTETDWVSIAENNKWVRSNIVDHVIHHLETSCKSTTVLIGNVPLERALFPSAGEVADLKRFFERNDPAKLGRMWSERWTKGLEFLLVPMNIQSFHWCLLVLNLRTGQCELWDSAKLPGTDLYQQIDRDRLQSFVHAFSPGTPSVHLSIARVPQQTGANCGVFMLEFIRAFLNGQRNGSEINVTEAQMVAFRARIVRELNEFRLSAPPVKNRDKKKD